MRKKYVEKNKNLFENISSKLFNLSKLIPASAPSGKTKIVFWEISGLLNSTNSSIIAFSLLCSKNLSMENLGEIIFIFKFSNSL